MNYETNETCNYRRPVDRRKNWNRVACTSSGSTLDEEIIVSNLGSDNLLIQEQRINISGNCFICIVFYNKLSLYQPTKILSIF